MKIYQYVLQDDTQSYLIAAILSRSASQNPEFPEALMVCEVLAAQHLFSPESPPSKHWI